MLNNKKYVFVYIWKLFRNHCKFVKKKVLNSTGKVVKIVWKRCYIHTENCKKLHGFKTAFARNSASFSI